MEWHLLSLCLHPNLTNWPEQEGKKYLLGSFQMVTPSFPVNKHQHTLISCVQIKGKSFSFHLSDKGFVCASLHPDLTQVNFSHLHLALLWKLLLLHLFCTLKRWLKPEEQLWYLEILLLAIGIKSSNRCYLFPRTLFCLQFVKCFHSFHMVLFAWTSDYFSCF